MNQGVEIRVRSDSTQARRDLTRLERSIGNIETTVTRASRTIRNLGVAITAALTGSAITRAFTTATDSITNLENRLALVVGRGAELNQTMRDLYAVAARSRLPVAAAADTFNRLGLALQDSGTSNAELQVATEAILQSAAISGATAESANAAIIQLGQGLGSGELRGQELLSVLEQMPRLARAIAEGMGVPFGELKSLAEDGQLTAEAVFAAILSQAENLDLEFQTIEATTSGLVTVLRDELSRALSALDTEFGFSERIRTGVIIATEALRYFADNVQTWLGLAEVEFDLFQLRLALFTSGVREGLRGVFDSLMDPDLSGLSEAFDGLLTSISDNTSAILVGVGLQDVETIRANLRSGWEQVTEGFSLAIDIIATDLSLTDVFPGMQSALNTLNRWKDNVVAIFENLHSLIVGDSWWWGIFHPGHEEGGAAAIGNTGALLEAINPVIGVLSGWKNNVVNVFRSLFTDALEQWSRFTNFLMVREPALAGDLVAAYETEPTRFANMLSTMERRWDQFRTYISNLNVLTRPATEDEIISGRDFRVPTAFGRLLESVRETSGYVKDIFDTLANSQISQDIVNFFEDFNLSASSEGLLAALSTKLPPLRFLNFDIDWGQLFEGFAEGAKTATGTLLGLGALIWAGFSVAALAPLRIGAVVTGLVLGPDVLAGEVVQQAIRTFGLVIGQLIGGSVDGDSVFYKWLKAIGTSMRTLGSAFVEGVLGEPINSAFGQTVADLIGAALITAGAIAFVSPKLFKPLGKAAKKLASKIVLSINTALFGTAISSSAIIRLLAMGFAAVTVPAVLAELAGLPLWVGIGVGIVGLLGKGLAIAFAGAATAGGIVGAIVAGIRGATLAAMIRFPAIAGAIAALPAILAGGAIIGTAILAGIAAYNYADELNSFFSNLFGTEIDFEASSYALFAGFAAAMTTSAGRTLLSRGVSFAFSNPITGTIAAVVGAALAVDEFELDERFREFRENLRERVEGGLNNAFQSLGFSPETSEMLAGIGATVLNSLLTPLQAVLDVLGLIGDLLTGDFASAWETVTGVINSVTEAFDRFVTRLENLTVPQWLSDFGAWLGNGLGANEEAMIDFSSRENFGNHATGGYISGPGTGTSDDIPAMLSNGEYVIRASSVSKFGRGFLDAVNAGFMPSMFNQGGYVGNEDNPFLDPLQEAIRLHNELAGQDPNAWETRQAAQALESANRRYWEWEEGRGGVDLDALPEDLGGLPAPGSGGGGGGEDDRQSRRLDAEAAAKSYADGFKSDFSNALTRALMTGEWDEFLPSLLDSFTSNIIQSFVDGLTDSLFGDNEFFDMIFGQSISFGANVGEKVNKGITESLGEQAMSLGEEGGGFLSGIFGEGGFLSGIFGEGGLFSNLFSSIQGLFSGGGGLFSSLFSIFGFNDGGVVPSLGTTRTDIDSVPAMLTPGEMVLTKEQQKALFSGNSNASNQNTVVNLQITGDISRQTKQEVMRMIPQIASGVNMTNKENNYRG